MQFREICSFLALLVTETENENYFWSIFCEDPIHFDENRKNQMVSQKMSLDFNIISCFPFLGHAKILARQISAEITDKFKLQPI